MTAKVFGCVLVAAAIAATTPARSEFSGFHQVIERQTEEWLHMNPQLVTSLGVGAGQDGNRHAGMLNDTSLEALRAERAYFARAREEIDARDPSLLEGQEALTFAIAKRQYAGALERAAYTYAVDLSGRTTFAIDHMHGPQTSLTRFMKGQHRLVDAQAARDYVDRLEQFDAAFDGALARMEMQRDAGVIPPEFVIRNVLQDARIFIAPPPAENALVRHLSEKLEEIDGMGAASRAEILNAAVDAMSQEVYPAFQRLIAAYQPLQSQASNHGVWSLPDGLDYYDTMLRVETTTDISADEIHALGLAEVARIRDEMDTILRAQGLTEGPVGERVRELGQDPKYLFDNDERGREQLVAYLVDLLGDMHERQQAHFGTLPQARVVVERVPEFAQASQTIAYYGSGSIDGSRPGTYFINLRDTRDMPRWSLPSLSYHEAIPGHHLQIMLAREIEDLPLYRRIIGVTGFVEGWALYAERLAWEMGAYDDYPLGNLGRLQYEMWRAVRMVVDTGIHVKRWSKQEAIDYFIAMTGMSVKDATTEIERYFVTPGSAPAYKLGMLRIQELRDRAQQRLGEDFDIRAFHDAVLGNGPLPLSVLEEVVEGWIADQQREPGS